MKKASKVLFILAGLTGLFVTFLLVSFGLFSIGSLIYTIVNDITDNQPTETAALIEYIADGAIDLGIMFMAGFTFIASIVAFLGLINKKPMAIIALVFSILVFLGDFLLIGLLVLYAVGTVVYLIQVVAAAYVIFIITAIISAQELGGTIAIVLLIFAILRIILLGVIALAVLAMFVMFIFMLIASILSLKAIKKQKLEKENKKNDVEVIEVS